MRPERSELVDLLAERDRRIVDLEREVKALRKRVDELVDDLDSERDRNAILEAELEEARTT